jgi:hypothetical protein
MGEPAVTSTRTPQTPNTALYECGHWYSRQLAQLLKEGAEPKAALDEIGQSAGTSRAEVGTAIDFYDSVNFIVGTAAREARTLILGGRNPHLAPDVVREIARRSPPSQESAMDRAALGLHPFARPVPPGTPPDLIRWDHDLDRLDRAKRMLQQAEVAVTDGRPSRQLRSDIYRNALAVRVATAALNLSLGIDTHFPAGAGPAPNSSPATQGIGLAGACAFVAKARRLVEGVTRAAPGTCQEDAGQRDRRGRGRGRESHRRHPAANQIGGFCPGAHRGSSRTSRPQGRHLRGRASPG